MEVRISATAFGITGAGDPAEAALQLLERPDKAGELLVDFAKIEQVSLQTDSVFAVSVLRELDCAADINPSSNGNGKLSATSPHDLMAMAHELSWVVLAPGMEKYKRENGFSPKLLLANSPPNSPSLFRQIIQMEFTPDGKSLIIKIDGQAIAAVNTVCALGRFDSDLKRALNKVAEDPHSSSEKTTKKIVLPNISPTASLEAEIAYLNAVIASRLKHYSLPNGRLSEAILNILLDHAEKRIALAKSERARLCNIIAHYTTRQKPITIGISFAIGTRILNPLKFRELIMMPTWAWLYFGFYFKTINEKVKRLYPPGIKVVIFDEATMFSPVVGMQSDGVANFLTTARCLFSRLNTPIEIIELRPEWFPEHELTAATSPAPSEQIYAMLCSLTNMADPEIMRPLYVDRHRNYNEIKKRAGSQWQRAEGLVLELNKRLAYRKSVNLFAKLLQEELFIDGCVTDKTDRLVFDITNPALINHGMPVVRRTDAGMLKVQIVPEYRIEDEHRGARPIKISPAEFGLPNLAPYTFYYLVE